MVKDKHKESKMVTAPKSATSSNTRSADVDYANDPKATINDESSIDTRSILSNRIDSGSGTAIDTGSSPFARHTISRTRDLADLWRSDALRWSECPPSPVRPCDPQRDMLFLAPGEWQHPVEPYDRHPTLRPRHRPYQEAHAARPHPVLPVPFDNKPTFKVPEDRKLRFPNFAWALLDTKSTPIVREAREVIPTTKPLPPATAFPPTMPTPKIIAEHKLLQRLDSPDPAPQSFRTTPTNTIDPRKTGVGLETPVTPLSLTTLPRPKTTNPLVPIILSTDANSNSNDQHLSHEILLLDPFTATLSTLRDVILCVMLSGKAESNLKLQGN